MRAIASLLLLCSALSAQGPSAQNPIREVTTDAIVNGPLAGLYNGHLFFIDRPDRVRVYSPDGHLATSFDVQDRGGEPSYVESIAIDSDGSIVAAWANRPGMNGIEIHDAAGTLIRAIDTGMFAPGNITFGPDHSLWSTGRQRDPARPLDPAKDYLVLRHYSSDGKELGAYLPRSLFPPGLEPGGARAQERRIFVTPSFIGLVVFSGDVGSKQEWVELDLNGNIRGRWPLIADQFFGVALTSDGQVYARQRDSKGHKGNMVRLDRAAATWQVVPITAEGTFYGADGDQLVFGSWPMHGMVLRWFKQP